MDLDFDKYSLVDGSPTTVLPAPRHRLSVANRKPSNPKCRNDTTSLTEEFEINFVDYRSGSCRDIRSQRFSREVLKRGSVYQSSEEVRLVQKIDDSVGRKKIEFSPAAASSLSLGIINSLCSSDEEGSAFELSRSSVMSLSERSTNSAYGNGVEFRFDDSATTVASASVATEEDKSPSSARFSLPHSPATSECDSSIASSPKARFSPIRKMFNPFLKSKSRRSLNENYGETVSGLAGMSRNRAVCRSLLGDMLEKPQNDENNDPTEGKENHNSDPQSSPAHLHGVLKMGSKHGMPFFQFSVKSPEDVYVAKAWKVENTSSWVYTFHLLPHRRRRSSSGLGFKECKRDSSMVAQMLVSCHQYTEFKGAGQLNDSMVTEFVLHDILHSRKSTSSKDKTDTHPELETAAIVMQVPLETRESLKFKSGDKEVGETSPHLLDLCRLGEGGYETLSPRTMHVVIPDGKHSLPESGSSGPSPLLDRWRLGGGCDCGGWDMACSLNIFTNEIAEGQPRIDKQSRAELFVQGRRDKTPAFTMRVMEDGKYTVDFHAQLSSLQAFSICVAILHAAEASTGQETSKQTLQSDSLRVLTEEEIKSTQEALAEEEKPKSNKVEILKPSFILNPPFSPIARV